MDDRRIDFIQRERRSESHDPQKITATALARIEGQITRVKQMYRWDISSSTST